MHHFYETINRERLIADLKAKGRISAQTMILLDKHFATDPISAISGLPRGLNVSAMLSEF